MTNLTQASHELSSRPADERFETLAELASHCHNLKDRSRRLKEPSAMFCPEVHDGRISLRINGYPPFGLNDWSFSQLCSLAKVAKDTVNRLQPETAAQVLTETLQERSEDDMDLQALVYNEALVRSVNGERYSQLPSKLETLVVSIERLQNFGKRLRLCASRKWLAAAAGVSKELGYSLPALVYDINRQQYPSTLFAGQEAYAGSCTAKATIYCANVAAGLMLSQFAKWLRRLAVDFDLQLNLLSAEMACYQPCNEADPEPQKGAQNNGPSFRQSDQPVPAL